MADRGFDERWRRNPKPQVTTESVFWQKTGWRPDDLKGRTILDAGCGCGRFSQLAARYADRVIGIDLAPHALEAARENAPAADIYEDNLLEVATVPPESVDLAFAMGTLHHTGNTRKAFAAVARTVKVGGQLSVWLYCKPVTDDATLPAVDMLHEITRAVPPETLYAICEKYSVKLRDVYAGSWGPLQQVLRISNSPDDAECVSDTFDWHCPQYRDWHTNEEVIRWFEEEGFKVDWVGEFPTSVRGVKVQSTLPRVRQPGEKPRVLLISDVRGWAFDQNMQDLEAYVADRFEITHGYVAEWQQNARSIPNMRNFDSVYALYHRWGIEHLLPMERTLGALRARWIFPENKRVASETEFALVNSYVGYQVVTWENYDELIARCPGVRYLTNPVNMQRFPHPTPKRSIIIASWNGNAGHSNALQEDVKGFYSIVVPACHRAGVQLEYAEYNSRRLGPSQMPAFYQKANVSLCASLYEGASNSVMEAMASGLAVIATDVGNHREMHESQLAEYGDSGMMLVERNREAFIDALLFLKKNPERVVEMGRLNRMEIDRAWSWHAWADRYAEFLLMPVEKEGLR